MQLLKRHGLSPLSPDALTGWSAGQPDQEEHNRKVRQATKFLLDTLIPAFAEELDKAAAVHPASQLLQLGSSISHHVHKRGD